MITRMSGAAASRHRGFRISRRIFGNCFTTAAKPMIDSSSIGNSEVSPSRAMDGRRRPRTARRRRAAGAAPSSGWRRAGRRIPPSRSGNIFVRMIVARAASRGQPRDEQAGFASAASIMACGSATIVLPAMTAMPASPAPRAPSMVRGPIVGRSKRKSWPLFGAFTSTPRPRLGANAALLAQPRHARQQAIGALDVLDRRPHGRRSRPRPGRCRTDRARAAPRAPRDIGSRILVGAAREASLGHQQIGRDILDAHHSEAVLLEDAADPGQQMIVAAAERSQTPDHAQACPSRAGSPTAPAAPACR
jgi:hypothetical protein